MQVAEVSISEISPPLRSEWLALARRSGPGAFFSSPPFVEAFARVFVTPAQVSVLTIRDRSGELFGLLPLCRSKVRRGLSLATRYAYLQSDFAFLRDRPKWLPFAVSQISTPLCLEATSLRSELLALPDRRAEVLARLASALPGCGRWNVGIFAVDEADAVVMSSGLQPRARLHRLGRPLRFLLNPPPLQHFVAAKNKKFRSNTRRAERNSEEAGVVFSTAQGSKEVGSALGEFADVAARSWKQPVAGGRADAEDVLVPYTPRQRQFIEALVPSPDVEPLLFGAWLDGKLLAGMLAFRFGSVLTTILLYTDAAAGRLSAGRLVLHSAIDHAASTGLPVIDWNSNATWTKKYSNYTSVRHNLLVIGGGIGGNLLRYISRVGGDPWLSFTSEGVSVA